MHTDLKDGFNGKPQRAFYSQREPYKQLCSCAYEKQSDRDILELISDFHEIQQINGW